MRTRGPRAARWIDAHCPQPGGDYLGEPFQLRPWQRGILDRIFELEETAEGWRLRYRRVLLGLPSGSGKTTLVAAIALYLLASGEQVDPNIVVAAASREQAGLVYDAARRMVQESATLGGELEAGANSIRRLDGRGQLVRVSAAEGTNDGRNISGLICDELHEWKEVNSAFNVLTKATAKRRESMSIFITTAGRDMDTIAGRLYRLGRDIEEGRARAGGFLMLWKGAPEDADVHDEGVWRAAHPALGDFMSFDAFRHEHDTKPESVFRRYQLNQWREESEDGWLPQGAWEACGPERAPRLPRWPASSAAAEPDEERLRRVVERRLRLGGFDLARPVHLAWDASTRYDSTAIAVVQAGEGDEPVRVGARIWERPVDDEGRPVEGWLLPIEHVTAHIRAVASLVKVAAIQFDPAFVTWVAADLAEQGLPMREMPQTPGRMGPASQAFYEAVVGGRLRHDGDPDLARHVLRASARQLTGGSAAWRLVKGMGKHPMDAAIAVAMGIWSVQHPPAEKVRTPFRILWTSAP